MVSTNRPRTPSGGTSPPADKLTSASESNENQPPARRTGFGTLLRRSKSGDLGPKLSKKRLAKEAELARQREAIAISRVPPSLPKLFNGATPPELQTFGGDGASGMDGRASSTVPRGSIDPGRSYHVGGAAPPVPGSNGAVDPYARTESMTHRGRYSYASSAISTSGINSPRRVRRRKDPTPFNILIIGARSSGKTSFLEFLKTALAIPKKKGLSGSSSRPTDIAEELHHPNGQAANSASSSSSSGTFIPHYLETEIDGERIGLTLWDSEGLDKSVVDLQLREMSSFLESKFEETFTEEMKVMRAPGVQDTHIHCAFLVLDPVRLDQNVAAAARAGANSGVNGMNGKYGSAPRLVGGLDEDLDLNVLRTLQGKTTVVPVIAKADTITTAHMTYLKKMVWDSLRKANLDPLEALGLDEGEDGSDGKDSPRDSQRLDERDEDDAEAQANDAEETPNRSMSKRLSSGSIRAHKRQFSLTSPSPPSSDPTSTTSPSAPSSSPEGSGEIPYLPLSILSPDIYEPAIIGRKFPWGFADPYNVEHCDFVRLKEAVFSEWRGELREASRELWYEGWRTSRLNVKVRGPGEARGLARR